MRKGGTPRTPSSAQPGMTPVPPRGLWGALGPAWAGFLIRWAAFFGFIVSASNCPFCGRTGCPQGIVTSGVAAGIVVALAGRKRRPASRVVGSTEEQREVRSPSDD